MCCVTFRAIRLQNLCLFFIAICHSNFMNTKLSTITSIFQINNFHRKQLKPELIMRSYAFLCYQITLTFLRCQTYNWSKIAYESELYHISSQIIAYFFNKSMTSFPIYISYFWRNKLLLYQYISIIIIMCLKDSEV